MGMESTRRLKSTNLLFEELEDQNEQEIPSPPPFPSNCNSLPTPKFSRTNDYPASSSLWSFDQGPNRMRPMKELYRVTKRMESLERELTLLCIFTDREPFRLKKPSEWRQQDAKNRELKLTTSQGWGTTKCPWGTHEGAGTSTSQEGQREID